MRKITMPMSVVDMKTGEVVEERTVDWMVAPPDTRDGKCPQCAVKHDLGQPHNAQSLAYQYDFRARKGRWPTWADAVAHCSPEVKAAWKAELTTRGAWTEPSEEEKGTT